MVNQIVEPFRSSRVSLMAAGYRVKYYTSLKRYWNKSIHVELLESECSSLSFEIDVEYDIFMFFKDTSGLHTLYPVHTSLLLHPIESSYNCPIS